MLIYSIIFVKPIALICLRVNMFTYQASSLVTRPDAETNKQADRVNRDFKNAWPFAQQGFCSGVVSRFCGQEKRNE
jgi:hypothetical protein